MTSSDATLFKTQVALDTNVKGIGLTTDGTNGRPRGADATEFQKQYDGRF
jgi:hypothetical protein